MLKEQKDKCFYNLGVRRKSKKIDIKDKFWLSIVAHACNPRYAGAGYGRIIVHSQPGQNFVRPYHKKQAQL
jgi:hypothetical protein